MSKKPYYVSQTFTMWAESPEEAARIVRSGQRYALLDTRYREFAVIECTATPHGSTRRALGARMRSIEVEE